MYTLFMESICPLHIYITEIYTYLNCNHYIFVTEDNIPIQHLHN